DQQDRGVADVVYLGVTDLREHLLTAGELPHPAPQPGLLKLVELPGEVTADRDVGVPEVAWLVPSQCVRYRLAVQVEEVLVARAVAAEPSTPGLRPPCGQENVSSVSNRR